MSDKKFTYQPSQWVPFRDKEVIDRVAAIKREDMEKHPNPDYKIRVVPDASVEHYMIADMVRRLKESSDTGKKVVMILPNPVTTYRYVARMCNALDIDCHNLYAFAMDEYADQDGNIAPEDWECGFTYAMLHNFYYELDPKLRPERSHFVGFTNKNINDYSKMIQDAGEADIVYAGPGWTGHLAFIEPDAPEFQAPLEEWKQMGARICTLSPFTLAQNSLHGAFGLSGNLAAVPPKAATIGPRDVLAAKYRHDTHALTIHGTSSAWQRFTTRLVLHGPVSPRIPESIMQTVPTNVFVSETIAKNIEPDWVNEY